jgi:hypothetical protein
MVEENKQLPEGKTGYEGMAVEEPERELELSEDELAGVSSLSKRTELAPNLSDMQTAMIKLFPEDIWPKAKKLYDLVQVGRISPDVFMSLLRIMVKEAVRRSDPKKPLHIGEMVAMVYSVLSIGLDGKGRIDALELAGAAREEQELSKLGGGGSF